MEVSAQVYNQHKSEEQIEKEVESVENEEPVKQIETNQEIEPERKEQSAVHNEEDGKSVSIQKPAKKGRGRPPTIIKRKMMGMRLLLHNKNAGRPDHLYQIPEPEQWESRLRQSGRELVRNKIKISSEEIMAVSREERCDAMRQRAAQRTQQNREQNGAAEFTFVKVEGDVGISDEQLQQQNAGISEIGFVKVEVKNEFKERFSQQNRFIEFTVVEVEENRHNINCDAQLENCSSSIESASHPVEKRPSRYHTYKARLDRQRAIETPEEKLARLRLRRLKRAAKKKAGRGRKRGEKDSASKNNNLLHKAVLHTQSLSTPSITTEPKTDIVGTLLDSICRTQHSHHPQQHHRLKTVGNLCTSGSSDYILSAVIWHKLNRRRIDEDIRIEDASFALSDELKGN